MTLRRKGVEFRLPQSGLRFAVPCVGSLSCPANSAVDLYSSSGSETVEGESIFHSFNIPSFALLFCCRLNVLVGAMLLS